VSELRDAQVASQARGAPHARRSPAAKEHSGSLLADCADALVAVDCGGTITDMNAAAYRLFGPLVGKELVSALKPETPSGQPVCPDGWPPLIARLPACVAILEQEIQVLASNGPTEVSVTARLLRDRDHLLEGAVLSFRDLTPRRRLELSSTELISTVSHELRSPLASVKGYSASLLHRWDRFEDGDKRFMIEQINHEADRVTRLINELLEITRLESGRLTLHPAPIDLPTLTEAIVHKLLFAHPAARVEIAFPDPFPSVYADHDKVEQVLTNLIENAAKYGDPATIEVGGRVDEADKWVRVSVNDRGEGIEPEVLPRIFTKFYRAENRVGRPSGTGLGLYIARGLAEAHGGSLSAESTVGEGSTFTLLLPLSAPA
jgi:signal transduction histidine kinase